MAALSIGGLVWLGLKFELSKSDWASWVQAVGSIGAIAGAWLVGHRQSSAALRHALYLRRAQEEDRIQAIFPIASHALDLIEEIADKPFRSALYSEASFQSCLRAMESIPLYELGKYVLVQGYLEMQAALSDATRAASERSKYGENTKHSTYRDRAEELERRIHDAKVRAIDAIRLIKAGQPLMPDVNYVATPTGELVAAQKK